MLFPAVNDLLNLLVLIVFDILDFKMQAHTSAEQTGLWVLVFLGAKSEEVYKQPIQFDYKDHSEKILGTHQDIPLDPDIIHEA